MKKLLLCAVLAALPLPAQADETAKAANQLLAAQLMDAVTTRAFLQNVPGSFERDPLVRPFTHSNAGSLAGVIVTNLAVRLLFRHSPKVIRLLTGVEGVMVVNNFRVLGHP